jgi:hypothetical protein
MRRLLLSVAVGTIIGVTAGFIIGWGIAPVRYVDSPLDQLDPQYKEEYTVMVAAAFRLDGDRELAIERLRPLGEPNIPQWVQEITERAISVSRRAAEITDLVALSEALGRLTDAMRPYRLAPTPAAAESGD